MPNGTEAQSVWTEFSVANPEPSVSFSAWENSKYTYIRETDAAIGQQIDVSGGTCTKDTVAQRTPHIQNIGYFSK